MAFKRALVVDDSRTARQSLAKLLAQYDLEVAFAETGEEALAFLNHEMVDVVFMDHTMPGMDGLQAVTAIKANPRTATIPVMMYTTKEGEVYVSQARALGAVGVLPKQVQPGVLFDMLHKLALVEDRRTGETTLAGSTPSRRLTDLADDVDREYEQRALGVSLQTQVIRLLEEQHLKLRGDLLGGQRRFAHQVAEELAKQRQTGAPGDPAPHHRPRTMLSLAGLAAAVLAGCLVAMSGVTWHVMAARDAARLEVARLTSAARNELDALHRRNDGLAATLRDEHSAAAGRLEHAVGALQWSLNDSALVPYDELPFGDTAAEQLTTLLEWLEALGFQGRIVITAELAPFCLLRDAAGVLVPAPSELPMEGCDSVGHPLEAASTAALQSAAFAAVVREAAERPDISVRLADRQPADVAASLPSNVPTAGQWNRLAVRANRRHTALFPRLADAVAVRNGHSGREAARVE